MARCLSLANGARPSHRPPTRVGCSTRECGWLLASATSSEDGNWCFFCRICLPLFGRSMVCVVGFSVANRQFDCGCCAETATPLATGDQTPPEWEEERQKSRAEGLRSRSLLRRSSPQSMRRFLWPCDSTDGCAQRRDCGWLAKAQATARVDVPTAPRQCCFLFSFK